MPAKILKQDEELLDETIEPYMIFMFVSDELIQTASNKFTISITRKCN